MPNRKNPPNIVLVMADQLAPHFTGTYGHPVVKTPNLDALAARGTRFDAAYCNSPLCAPSRAAFMTGRLPSRIGAFDNASDFPSSVPTFAHYLSALGYKTCLSGRMHFVGPDQKHGFQERLTTDIYPADFAWVPDWRSPETRIDSWYHNMSSVLEAGAAQATFQTDYDDEVAFATRRWLMDRGRDIAAGEDQPFLLVASFMHPHDPYVAKPEFWDIYSEDDIALPTLPHATDPHSQRLRAGIEADTTPVTDDQIRNARRGYFANISYIDAKLGEILDTLDDIGARDNTLVIFTSDHGDLLGEHGLWYKMSFFEHSARVPLVISGPGVEAGVSDSICSLVDLAPTLVSAAGGALDFETDGRDLLAPTSANAIALSEYCAEMAVTPIFMVRKDHFKYIYSANDPALLFDLAVDPDEQTNLADDPAHADIVKDFEATLCQAWNGEAMYRDVLASQKSRRAVHAGMTAGQEEGWDYSPKRNARDEYVRNHMDWTEAASRYRFPPIKS